MIRTLCNECGTDEDVTRVEVTYVKPASPGERYLGRRERYVGDLCASCLKVMLDVLADADQGIQRLAG